MYFESLELWCVFVLYRFSGLQFVSISPEQILEKANIKSGEVSEILDNLQPLTGEFQNIANSIANFTQELNLNSDTVIWGDSRKFGRDSSFNTYRYL